MTRSMTAKRKEALGIRPKALFCDVYLSNPGRRCPVKELFNHEILRFIQWDVIGRNIGENSVTCFKV
jgi:hypothetical protein